MNRFLALTLLQAVVVVWWAEVAGSFGFQEPVPGRAYGALLAILALSFGLCAAAVRVAVASDNGARLAVEIVVSSILFRLLLVASPPILEIDIYRYLWDGAVTSRGGNPYRYAPQQVLAASASDASLPADLRHLAALREESAPYREILSRIHYEELTTIYPPVSVAVFAAADAVTPGWLSVEGRVTWLKGVLIGFDVATIAVLLLLLGVTGRPLGLAVAYAWNPLVLKEFANSGHLDAIAVFLTIWTLWEAIRLTTRAPAEGRWPGVRLGLLLALAIGAKLYAVVLTPLLFATLVVRRGWRVAGVFAVSGVVLASLLLAPTQNPWYWTWALPLLPFARSRLWSAVSLLAMAYYARYVFAVELCRSSQNESQSLVIVDCRRSEVRLPRETKGSEYRATEAGRGCGDDGSVPCC